MAVVMRPHNLPEQLRNLTGEAVAQPEWQTFRVDPMTLSGPTGPTGATGNVGPPGNVGLVGSVVDTGNRRIPIVPAVCLLCTKRFFESRGMSDKSMEFLVYEFEKNLVVGVIECWKIGIIRGWKSYLNVHTDKPLPRECPNDTEHTVCQEPPDPNSYPWAF